MVITHYLLRKINSHPCQTEWLKITPKIVKMIWLLLSIFGYFGYFNTLFGSSYFFQNAISDQKFHFWPRVSRSRIRYQCVVKICRKSRKLLPGGRLLFPFGSPSLLMLYLKDPSRNPSSNWVEISLHKIQLCYYISFRFLTQKSRDSWSGLCP